MRIGPGVWRRLSGAFLSICALAAPAVAQRNLAGAVQTKLALERLNVLGSLLLTGAHPDDENAALLAAMARGRLVRTAYLSLTRGDGGQNLIGSEQGELLGLLRTQEMLAARRIDGAEQFFTRAIDFGFSKTAEETLAKWGRDAILADMVWIIRRFRPDVLVNGISMGHGHHQASGILTREAFEAAGDKTRFPEQLRWVEPWQPARLVSWNFGGPARGGAQPGSIQINVGQYNPLLGYSYTEISGMSRSMHRSQGVGAPERRGETFNSFTVLAGLPAQNDLFDGIDTSWNRIPGGAAVAPLLRQAADGFDPRRPEQTIPLLLKARPIIASIRHPWAEIKLKELDEAVALCAGLYLDAWTGNSPVTPGQEITVNLEATNRSAFPLALEAIRLEGVSGAPEEKFSLLALPDNRPVERTLRVRIPEDQPLSQPYWLRRPSNGFTFVIEQQQLVGEAESPPVLQARFFIRVANELIELIRPVVHRYVDRVNGETRQPLAVAPVVAVNLSERAVVFPSAKPKPVEVMLKANAAGVTGTLRLEAPPGWRIEPAAVPFRLDAPGEERAVAFTVTPPAAAGEAQLRAVALAGNREISNGMRVLAHENIPTQIVFPPAAARLVRTDATTLATRIGYVMGAGDEVPAALRQLGCEVTLLNADDLARGDLHRFEAIVIGVRAYNVRADLTANQKRLLDYVREGGTLIVQYVTPDPRSSGPGQIGPYPFQLGGARVTLEDAPVRFLNPRHPLLNSPNRITEKDFEGWVQERGLYFASQWDERYEPLFESEDPNEPPQRGITLYARYGKGAYVFTSLALFRQLPAGVPGAFRLMANLLSAAKTSP